MIRLPQGYYMTVKEYADKLGYTRQAVYNALHQGRLKAHQVNKVWLIRSDSMIVNTRITHGRYIGWSALKRGDIKEFLRKKNIRTIDE